MSEETAETSERRKLPALVWGIIAQPRATLAYLNEHGQRTWWLPALLVLLLTLLPVLAAAPITARETREAVLASQEEMEEQFGRRVSEEERAQMVSMAANPLLTIVFPAVGTVLGRAIGWLVWAGALYLAGMALGGRSSFRQMFRVVVWTSAPYILRGLLQFIYILVSGKAIANPGLSGFALDNPTEAMALTAPSPGQMVLAKLLGRIDLFLLWNLALMIIGVMITTHLSRRKAALTTLGVWILLTILGLLPTLVAAFFMGQAAVGAGP